MSEPYLILHKVRGEPAFDIAHRIQLGDEEGWVLSACGYRAYPCWVEPLSTFLVSCEHEGKLYLRDKDDKQRVDIYPPLNLPDLFACNDRPLREEAYEVKAKAAGLLQSLGLIKKIERRI